MLECLRARGLVKARGQQRTDSTHILAAIRTLNRLELVGETMRFALNRLAAVAPAWVQTQLQPGWLERYGARVENYRLPSTFPQEYVCHETSHGMLGCCTPLSVCP